MGLKVVQTRWGKQKQYGCLTLGEPDWYDDQGSTELHNRLPEYSADLTSALLVVEHLRAGDPAFYWGVAEAYDGVYEAHIRAAAYAGASSAAEALCRAALKSQAVKIL